VHGEGEREESLSDALCEPGECLGEVLLHPHLALECREHGLDHEADAIGAPGSANRSAITQTITAHLAERGVTVDAWLPWDARGLTRAQRRGAPLSIARQRSRYSRSISRLLQELFLPATATPTGRKRRLASPRQPASEEQVVWQS
jgi:hypothetical protein